MMAGFLVGLSDRIALIGIVEHLGPQSADIHGVAHIAGLLGLAAAVDAAAGASHDLDEVVIRFAGLYLLKQGSGVAQAGGYGNLHIQAGYRVGGLLDAFHAADFGEIFKLASSSPVKVSTAVRRAASITPPVAPKITAAPVPSPNGASKPSSGRFRNLVLPCGSSGPALWWSGSSPHPARRWLPDPAAAPRTS